MRNTNVLSSLLLGLALVVLAGCASATKVGAPPTPEVHPEKGLVYFFRESRFVGGGVSFNVRDNGEVIGALKNGTYFFHYVEPGEHVFSARTEVERERAIQIEAGKVYYIKGSISMGVLAGRPELTIVDEAEARLILPGLTYAVKANRSGP